MRFLIFALLFTLSACATSVVEPDHRPEAAQVLSCSADIVGKQLANFDETKAVRLQAESDNWKTLMNAHYTKRELDKAERILEKELFTPNAGRVASQQSGPNSCDNVLKQLEAL